MASKRLGIVTGGVLAGALLLGTAGLALAQDPLPAPTAGPSWGSGMMGSGSLTPEQMGKMDALHDEMFASGTCDPAQMPDFHAQLQS